MDAVPRGATPAYIAADFVSCVWSATPFMQLHCRCEHICMHESVLGGRQEGAHLRDDRRSSSVFKRQMSEYVQERRHGEETTVVRGRAPAMHGVAQ